jgi:hypothetical protein
LEEDEIEEEEDLDVDDMDEPESPPFVDIQGPRVPELPPTLEFETSNSTSDSSFMSLDTFDPNTKSFILAT